MSEMPEKIWTFWSVERGGHLVGPYASGGTEYVRADLYAQLEAENAALRARVTDCEADRDSWRQQAEQHADLALKLAEELEGHRKAQASISEALNSGDGSYRP